MKLRKILLEMLNEVSFKKLKAQFVDTGKVTQETFNKIMNSSNDKSAYATWLIPKVVNNVIKTEDLYKWKDYFNIFDKYKSKFTEKDINKIKTGDDIKNFVIKAIDIKNDIEKDPSKAGGSNKFEKYKEFYIGNVEGFTVFELPKGRTDLYGISCDLGSGTEWCTASGKTRAHFNSHINRGPLFIFIKKGSDEKYQFSYEGNEFMDKYNNSII